jgi:hypothetical protein
LGELNFPSPTAACRPVEAQDLNFLLVSSTVTAMEIKQLQIGVLLNTLLWMVNNHGIEIMSLNNLRTEEKQMC